MKNSIRKQFFPAVWLLAVFLCVSGCGKEVPVWKISGGEELRESAPEGEQTVGPSGITHAKTESAPKTPTTGESQSGRQVPEPVAGEEETPSIAEPVAGEQETPRIAVHVCGQVQNPGVYYLKPGDRAVDAVTAAGGFTPEADPEALNLAAFVWDAQRLYIPSEEEAKAAREAGTDLSASGESAPAQNPYAPGQSASAQNPYASGESAPAQNPYAPGQSASAQNPYAPGESASGQTAGDAKDKAGKVNINTASKADLLGLPGIGESKAQAILSYRETHGAFRAVEDIMQVPGIKQGIFEQIQGYLVVG